MLSFGKLLKYIGSVKFTVLCLIFLFILVIGGTFYQVNSGLLAAQDRFFGSWGLLLFNFLPFPGLKTIGLVLTFNLVAAAFKNFSFSLRKTGMLLAHLGAIILLVGSGITSFFMKDSVVSLYEGDHTSYSRDFKKWELIVTKKGALLQGNLTTFKSDTVEFSKLKTGQQISFPHTELTLTVDRLYSNCTGLGYSEDRIDSLKPLPPSYDQAGSFPGIITTIGKNPGLIPQKEKIVLFGGNLIPKFCVLNSDTVSITLKPHEIQLPFDIGLTRFEKENHPGTSDAKSFKSYLTITGSDINRDVVISMNRPFRYKSLTFYQSGFSQNNNVNGTSLSVVDNSVRFVPYLSGFIVIAGLLINFIGMFVNSCKGLRKDDSGK